MARAESRERCGCWTHKRVESKLMSFTAGFKLAWGMAKELEADGLYSFEQEEEEHICHPAEQED